MCTLVSYNHIFSRVIFFPVIPLSLGILANFLVWILSVQFSSVTQSCPALCDPMGCSTPGLPVYHQLLELLKLMCHPTILSSVVPLFSCLQSFPVSGSFQMSQLLTSGGQSIGVSASISVLSMNTQDWYPLGWTGWISLQTKGLSRVSSNTSSKASTLQRSAFFIVKLSHPYMTTGKTIVLTLLAK